MRLAPAGATPNIEYAKAHANTSITCAAIRTEMVGIITAIKTKEECDCCFAPMARATCTTIVITNAWIAMVTKLTPPPTKNCRNMLDLSAHFVMLNRNDRHRS